MIHKDLEKQYNNLSIDEKNALLVYKSGLGLLINDLDNNPDFDSYYEKYKKIIDNISNMLMKYSVFNNINFDTIDTFKNSIYLIRDIVNEAIKKLKTNDDVVLYRLVSTNDINGLSKSNIISTSTSFVETTKFITNNNIYLFEIYLDKNSLVGYIPYSIKRGINNNLVVFKNDDQEEILLNKELYDFEIIDESKNEFNGFNLTIIKCNAVLKNTLKK